MLKRFQKQTVNKSAWLYYARYYQKSYRTLLLSVILSMGQSFIVVPIAFLMRQIFDETIPAGNINQLLLFGIIILSLYLTNSALTIYVRYITFHVTKVAIRQLREAFLQKLFAFPRSYYSTTDASRLHTSIVQDTERLDIMSNALVARFLPSLLISLAMGVVLVTLNWFLFVVMVSVVPILILFTKFLGRKVKQEIRLFHRSFETFSQGILFLIQKMDLIHLQAAEQFEVERQGEQLEKLRRISGHMAWLYSAFTVGQETVVALSGVIILIAGGILVASDRMTLGAVLSYYVVVGLLRTHLRAISNAIPQILTGNESLLTLFKLIQLDEAKPYSGHEQLSFGGEVTLEGVCFQYGPEPLLTGVSLTIVPKKITAIIGPNGSGKSTLLNLILGFYRPHTGEIIADRTPFAQVDIVHLRRQIGVVMQDPIIFPGTIFENITYGNSEATLEQVDQAAKLATAHNFINKLPQGYDTFVGEAGVLLSGGQRQRVAIARALLHKPRLLIMDEPTNHLDGAAIQQLIHNLTRLPNTPAILIVSHDGAVIQHAQKVYTLQDGRLVLNDKPRFDFTNEQGAMTFITSAQGIKNEPI